MARELILDEVFLYDEVNEIPFTLYYDYENAFFTAINEDGKVRYFKFKRPISEFTHEERERVMNYNYSTNDRPEKLSLDDVFVEGSMIEEVDESDVLFTNNIKNNSQNSNMENFKSVEDARAFLREQGYFVDNLWHVDDVKDTFFNPAELSNNGNIDSDLAMDVLCKTLTNCAVMETIWESMDIIAEGEFNLKKRNDE